jgi:hypothetical protein
LVRLLSGAEPEVASIRRRALAGVFDLLTILTAVAAWLAGLIWRSKRRASDTGSRLADEDSWLRKVGRLVQSKAWRAGALRGAAGLLSIPLRNWRSIGARVAGIQTVDARSGGPVTIRSAVRGALVNVAWRRLIGQLTVPLEARAAADHAQRQALEPQVRELLCPHAGDHAAQLKIREEFDAAHHIKGNTELPWRVASAVLMPLTSVLSRRRQTIRQRLSGTLVIRTR